MKHKPIVTSSGRAFCPDCRELLRNADVSSCPRCRKQFVMRGTQMEWAFLRLGAKLMKTA